jgi:predicted nucleic acid-binding protein
VADLIIDTDILIDAFRGDRAATAYLRRHTAHGVIGVSTITHLELLVGCRNLIEQRRIERFLQRFEAVMVNEETSVTAVELMRTYRLSHGLLLADALIAATALSRSKPLATKNYRDFRFIVGLDLVAYS